MSAQDNNQNGSHRSLIVNPNIGHPFIIKIDPKLKKRKFQAIVLFVSNIKNPRDFENSIENKISFIPIMEHKWKLKSKHDKKNERKKPKIRNRIKSKILNLIRSKKKIVKRSKIKPNIFRGEPIKPILYD